ncbi:MAG: hypothetical protein LC789_07050 [Actinobacteria bacterium]|nr:hypothetical protein [Actinomycetota bacterium]MCA1721779.1 hypothetical protein [Actinomycetota bacterium]
MSDDILDQLLNASLEAAMRLLGVDGEFYPFAVAMTVDGELVAPSVDPGEEQPTADRVVELLVAELRSARDGLTATALVSDVTIAGDEDQQRDAIRVDLEPRDGDPVLIVVPYREGPVLDEPFGVASTRKVFGS